MFFQDLILSLQKFWADKGCVIHQPYDIEVGAGTFNPATFLRALGPEPWNTAYVEPSRRPTDGRYGENPNRLQHYYQFQVIMKPCPYGLRGAVPRLPPRGGDRPVEARHPVRGGRLGIPHPRGVGARVGGVARRDGDHPVHLLPAVRRDRPEAGLRGDHLRRRADRHVPSEREQRLRSQVGRRRDVRRRPPPRRGRVVRSTTSRPPTSRCSSPCSPCTRRSAWASSSGSSSCPPTITA